MTDLEKIAYAKSFIDKLAAGIDPTDDSLIPEGDVAAKARIVGCFSYVSEVLGKLTNAPDTVAERESNQIGFDGQICPIPSSFPLNILPICPAGKALWLEKICCVKTARTRRRMHF